MPQLPFEAVKFGTPPSATSPLDVSWSELAWAAITVGASPAAGPIPSRPLLEMAWRALMVLSALDSFGGRFCKHDSYSRLDPSEKSAVSYFLGMTQAKVTLNRLLGVSHLVHLDPILMAAGRPLTGSRPDFLGVHPATGRLTVAVEAKGRTNGWTTELMKKAKEQARLLPSVAGRRTSMEIASAAWFDEDDFWHARLEDPDPDDGQDEPFSLGQLLVGYYTPIVGAFVRAQTPVGASSMSSPQSFNDTNTVELPDVDIRVELPGRLIEIWSDVTASPRGTATPRKWDAENMERLVAFAVATHSTDEDVEATTYRGPDGVTVHLGPTWEGKG